MATIKWHPNGCGSNAGVVTLVKPGALGSGSCIYNDSLFGGRSPSGGYEIQGMQPTQSVVIRQGPPDGEVCAAQIIGVNAQNGCYDYASLSNRIWWSFCQTGRDCPGMSQKKRSHVRDLLTKPLVQERAVDEPAVETNDVKETELHDKREPLDKIFTDAKGDFLLSTTGRRVAVIYRNTTADLDAELAAGALEKRQSQTFNPPSSCFIDANTCKSLASSGSLRAYCVDCVQGLGNGVKASTSAKIDCRNSGGPCIVTFTKSVTVTNTISMDISFGATIGDTGKAGANGMANFGFSSSISIATSSATSEGLSIPQGKIGYVQFQPQALLGTVVTTTSKSNNLCDSLGINKICGAKPGLIVSSNEDSQGQYSIVLTS